jgi:hypothetical protein
MQIKIERDRLRRLATITAGSSAALAVLPALSKSHGHPLLGLICIVVQMALLSLSIYFLIQSK